MTEHNRTYDQQQDVESHAPYLKVFGTLVAFTILEYLYASWSSLGFAALAAGLVGMAVVKAALVGAYFMHLKFEGRWVFAMLVPAGFLAAVLVLGLSPDIAFHARPDAAEQDQGARLSLPTRPGDAPTPDRPPQP